MKRLAKLDLNTRLIAVFFAAILLLSMGHFFIYSYLLETMQREENALNQERMDGAMLEMGAAFNEAQAGYVELLNLGAFKTLGTEEPSRYALTQMHTEASQVFSQIEHVHSWFIMLDSSSQLITNHGVSTAKSYFEGLCVSEKYNGAFWQARLLDTAGKHYFEADTFQTRTNVGVYEQTRLMPLAVRPGWNGKLMVVLLLDMQAMCQSGDAYLEEGIYLFSEGGELLYSSDAQQLITHKPQEGELIHSGKERYLVLSRSVNNGPDCVKLLPESEVTNLLKNNLLLCLLVALGAMLLVVVLVPRSIRSMLAPVNRMVNLVRQHSAPQEGANLHGVSQELEQILKNREQQAADLAQRDAALSEYFLHSRLKNVYVDMEPLQEQQDGDAYILYIQVQYQEKSRGSFAMSRAELENCLQEMMSGTLNRLFETTMVFQLEPGRFAARVTLPADDRQIDPPMARFMKRLDQEQEFACFIVVRSEMLSPQEDLAAVYNRVQEAARRAQVSDRSQLLTLPLPQKEDTGFLFPRQEEQQLDSLVRGGQIRQASSLAERILNMNLHRGISHAQMEILCVAMVNTVVYAATELTPSAEKIAAASGVYNTLTARCGTAREYIQAVCEFIHSVDNAQESKQHQETEQEQGDQLLNRIRQYLQDNYYREFSSEEMAGALWVSRSYLSSYYKSKTGMNLSDSIQLYRIQKAVELLQDPNIKIGDIGPMVGITSSNTFLRQFRKYTGMTPKEYRMKNPE